MSGDERAGKRWQYLVPNTPGLMPAYTTSHVSLCLRAKCAIVFFSSAIGSGALVSERGKTAPESAWVVQLFRRASSNTVMAWSRDEYPWCKAKRMPEVASLTSSLAEISEWGGRPRYGHTPRINNADCASAKHGVCGSVRVALGTLGGGAHCRTGGSLGGAASLGPETS